MTLANVSTLLAINSGLEAIASTLRLSSTPKSTQSSAFKILINLSYILCALYKLLVTYNIGLGFK